jgi:hypothetical protein
MTKTLDPIAVLRASPKFRTWKPEQDSESLEEILTKDDSMAEKHYSPQELAEVWGVSVETVRVLFREEPGVLKIGKDGTRLRRGYKTLRIPESVAERVHTRLSA